MFAVPAVAPVTIPPVPTVATTPLLLLQVPPVTASVNAVVEPAHKLATPVIPGMDALFTIITFVAIAVPQLPVTE